MDKLTGGYADGMTLSDVAEKHMIPLNIILKQYVIGCSVEAEHTDDEATIEEIVLDHLFEDPMYYDKLSRLGL